MRRRWFLTILAVAGMVAVVVVSAGFGGGGAEIGVPTDSASASHTRSEVGADSTHDTRSRPSTTIADGSTSDAQTDQNPVFAASLDPVVVDPLDPDPLPVPSPSPADPYADVAVPEIGRVDIPAIGLSHKLVEGVTLTAINEAPGHWPGTALPGARGNAVFPGHRTTYTRPFGDLDLLSPGDEIVFDMPDGTHTYEVAETLIVSPTDMWVVDQTETPTVTLIACHPKGSAAQRIVVKGELVDSQPSEAALESAGSVADFAAQLPV